MAIIHNPLHPGEIVKDELIDEDVATGIWIRPLFEFPIVKRYTGVGKSKS